MRSAGSAPASLSAHWSVHSSAAPWPMRRAVTAFHSIAPRRRLLVSTAFVWFGVRERFVPVAQGRGGRAVLSGLIAVARSPGLLPLFFVLLMAQFGVRTVQPVVTLFVQELVGDRPDLATLSGIAFSITGLANVVAAPFLGNKSDKIGYRRVLLISLLGAGLTTLPQAFAGSYWAFTAQRFAVGLFIGGIL